LAAAVLLAALSPPVQSLARLPREMRLLLGEEERFSLLGLPLTAVVRSDREGVLRINDAEATGGRWTVNLGRPVAVQPVSPGRCRLDLTLFGILPLRRLAVEVVPRLEVVPGGHSIGILVRTRGVAVVGHAPVEVAGGQVRYPAREAGVRVGDVILKVDGAEVKSTQHVTFLVNRCAREGRRVPLEISRGGVIHHVEVEPLLSEHDRIYQIGLYVRDGAAGVGTLTFYDPRSSVFMALGHIIADAATDQPLEVDDGCVVRATVVRVRAGRRGDPGEKEGTFVEDRDVLGRITANTRFGLVGVVTDPQALEGGETVPVALAREVVVGPAEILTVVEGTKVERFRVEITRVDTAQTTPAPKGITLRITDPSLLESTGGIVQGMSGSPILQNGKLIGAVTHVFVNDPTRGYGVFAEWMVREADLLAWPAGQEADPWPVAAQAAFLSVDW